MISSDTRRPLHKLALSDTPMGACVTGTSPKFLGLHDYLLLSDTLP